MSAVELRVIVNPHSSKSSKDQASKIARMNGSPLHTINSGPNVSSQKIIVAGGDGSVRAVLESVYRSEVTKPVGILAGGTNNIIYSILKKSGKVLPASEFVNSDEFPDDLGFRPGIFQERLFLLHVGLGSFEQLIGSTNEYFRGYLPRKLRPRAAYLCALSKVFNQSDSPHILDVYSTTSHLGYENAFPSQQFHGGLLTRAWIESGSKREEFMKLFFCLVAWQLHLRPPSSILSIKQKDLFNTENSPFEAWFDGDNLPVKSGSEIRRLDFVIPLVAII
ncbi:hypothetical protein HYT74_03025 [Candidatus Daviesbacteria bacterium]|nr:hypothetical protein [Candidatus Daviesbacteria bacterium]